MWPPVAQEVRDELRIGAQGAQDAAVLQQSLDAAVAYVQELRAELFAAVGDPPVPPPEPSPRIHLGTVRLAAHWYTNRVATTGVDPLTDLGGGPATYLPAAIQRMLGIGAYAKPRVG